MTILYSKALKNFLHAGGSLKQALSGGVINVYSGAAPASADAAVTGSLLYQFTDYAGSRGGETLSTGSAVYTGGMGGQIATLTVNGVSVIGAAVDNSGLTLAALMTALAARINAFASTPDYTASANANSVVISALPGTGTGPNGFVVAGTIAQAAQIGTMAGGVTSSGGSAEVKATVSTVFSGSGGGVDHIDMEYPGGGPTVRITNPVFNAVPYVSSPTQVATDAAANINGYASSPDATASSVGATLTVIAPAGYGASMNGKNIGFQMYGLSVATPFVSNFAGGVDAVPPTSETLATFQFNFAGMALTQISDITINGVSVVNAVVPYNATDAQTVTDLAASINTKVSAPDYTASAVGTTLTITAVAGSGATPNGFAVKITCLAALANSSYNNMAGGAASVGITFTLETRSAGTMTLTGGGAGNTINSVTVNGVNVLDAPVAYNASLAQTASDLVEAINNSQSSPEYTASASGAVVTLTAAPGTGTTPNTYVVAASLTGVTATFAAFAGGVASVNGLKFDYSANGVLRKLATQRWYACPVADSTGGYFRLIVDNADAGAADTVERFIRVQGTVGDQASGADMKLLKALYGKEQSIALTDVRLSL